MFEFNNRVDLQRSVVKIINNHNFSFEFTGLTRGSIEMWMKYNKIENRKIEVLLYNISEKLFFLANKSQEQITEDYKKLSFDVNEIIAELKEELKNMR